MLDFRSTSLLHAARAASVLALASACGSASTQEASGTSGDAVTEVPQSIVKRQSIGNCWIYATASWSESMMKTANGGAEFDVSESYWTYWHWFEQIVSGEAGAEVETGGNWDVAGHLIHTYGVMAANDFIAGEQAIEMSAAQATALDAINASMKSGALKTAAARADRATVRKELDKAWGLAATVTAQLDTVFGADVASTLDQGASTDGTSIRAAGALQASYTAAPGTQPAAHTLDDAVAAWHTDSYPRTKAARRTFQIRVQRALNDHQPVILSWFVDFNALDGEGRFAAPPATPGRQGGHMTVLNDYQIDGVPGFGTLAAGTDATPEQLAAALDPAARPVFFQVKNSWGSYRPDRNFAVPGYHDLYMKYLDGPVKRCQTDADENPDPNHCYDTTPWQDATFPPGY